MFREAFYNLLIAGSALVLLTTIASANINDQVAQLDFDTATLDDVIRIFGEPMSYYWGVQTYTKDDLPPVYIAKYPNDFGVVMNDGRVDELRFESPAAGFVFLGSIIVGSSLDEVLTVVGQPTQTIVGQPCQFQDGVLYKDINGTKGYCYYKRADLGVRMFFTYYKVIALYLTSDVTTSANTGCPWTVQPLTSINEYDDVRCNNISGFDLSDRSNLPATLWFNKHTIWPEPAKMPQGCDPNQLMTAAMNPGLGVRQLHQDGITGKGVNVAIIDQPMYLNHPEFAGKIVAYYDTGCNAQSSMHGPAVTSLLVGTNCGTAPEAKVYYAAAPSWLQDAAYYADALDWIIQQNKNLPAKEKIRVVSVSAAPSGPGSPFVLNNSMWDDACARAESEGMLVLDCTSHRGIIGRCWYDSNDPENVTKCTPGAPGMDPWFEPNIILTPSSPRTTAEQYYSNSFSYQYCGRGGLSWSIPYCAGVLAMGWQIRPELSGDRMCQLLFESAYVNPQGAKIINPQSFIELVRQIPSADLDRDGDVDFADFSLFAEQWMQAK